MAAMPAFPEENIGPASSKRFVRPTDIMTNPVSLYPRSVSAIHVESGSQAYLPYLIDVAHAAEVSTQDVDDIHARLPGALEEFDVVFDSVAVAKTRFVEHREPDAQRHRQIRTRPFAVPQPSQY